MNKFTFSILHWCAKSDLSKSMNKAHCPSGLFVEWSWLKSSISNLWKSFGGKQGGLFGFTPNQTKNPFFNFPWTGNWENISFWQSQHMKLPPGNNLTARSSCSVKSTFLVFSCLLISHLAFPSSCQGAPAPHCQGSPSQSCSYTQPFLHNWPQIPHFHSFQAPAYGDRTCQASQLYSRKLGSPGACGSLRASTIGSPGPPWSTRTPDWMFI